MVLDNSLVTRKNESSTEELHKSRKFYYEFSHPVRPKKLIRAAIENNDSILSYHTSRIHKNYYTIGIYIEQTNEEAVQFQVEIWDDGFSIQADNNCPKEYVNSIVENIKQQVSLSDSN